MKIKCSINNVKFINLQSPWKLCHASRAGEPLRTVRMTAYKLIAPYVYMVDSPDRNDCGNMIVVQSILNWTGEGIRCTVKMFSPIWTNYIKLGFFWESKENSVKQNRIFKRIWEFLRSKLIELLLDQHMKHINLHYFPTCTKSAKDVIFHLLLVF